MTDPKTRKAVLARRAKFLAAALAATMPACEREKEGIEPDHPATTKPDPVDAAPPTKPPAHDAAMAMPCLEVMPPVADAGPPPHPCLKIPPPKDAGPAPHPCLKAPTNPDF